MSQGHIASAECGLASSNARLTVMLWNFHTASKKACASKSTKVKLGGGPKNPANSAGGYTWLRPPTTRNVVLGSSLNLFVIGATWPYSISVIGLGSFQVSVRPTDLGFHRLFDMLITVLNQPITGLLTLALQSPPGRHRILMIAARIRYEWRERKRGKRG